MVVAETTLASGDLGAGTSELGSGGWDLRGCDEGSLGLGESW